MAQRLSRSRGFFSSINYFSFVCLTTVGFGDINPILPPALMASIGTSVAGPLYLSAVMGVLIGRFAAKPIFSDKKKESTE